MNSGLMEREEMEKLGMVEEVVLIICETSWKSEDDEKKFLFQKIMESK